MDFEENEYFGSFDPDDEIYQSDEESDISLYEDQNNVELDNHDEVLNQNNEQEYENKSGESIDVRHKNGEKQNENLNICHKLQTNHGKNRSENR